MALSHQRRTSRAELGSRRRNLLDDGRARTLRTSHHTAAQRLAGPPTDEVLPGTSRPSGQPPWHRRRLRQRSRSPITVRGSISFPEQIPPSAPSARSALGATSNCRRHDSRSRPAESGIPAQGIPARGIPARGIPARVGHSGPSRTTASSDSRKDVRLVVGRAAGVRGRTHRRCHRYGRLRPAARAAVPHHRSHPNSIDHPADRPGSACRGADRTMRFSYQFPLWRTRMAEAVTAVMMAFWRGREHTSFEGLR